MALVLFLFQVFVISLSGVTGAGTGNSGGCRNGRASRYAGTLIAIGHAVIEFPLIILIILGMDKLLKSANTQMVIGLAGGLFLLAMAIQMLIGLKAGQKQQGGDEKHRPVLAGIILSATNPYFLLWWATIGLSLAIDAMRFGICGFALFAIVHWLCDLVWFQILSWASFKGSALLGRGSERIVLLICSSALLFFGLVLIYKASGTLAKLF